MITLRIDNLAILYSASGLSGAVLSQIKNRLSFPNPKYLENEKRGFSNWNIPQEIKGYRIEGDSLIIPRGFSRQLVGIFRGASVEFKVEDRRRVLPEVDFSFLGELHDL